MPAAAAHSRVLVFVDVDRDGDLDLFVGNAAYQLSHGSADVPNRLFRNDGSGTFADATSQIPVVPPLNTTADAAAADVDGDGDEDLVVGMELLTTRWTSTRNLAPE